MPYTKNIAQLFCRKKKKKIVQMPLSRILNRYPKISGAQCPTS